MNDVVIRVQGLSKLYRLGQREPYKTMRDLITKAVKAPFHRLTVKKNIEKEDLNIGNKYIWALKDVFFEIKQGEIVGIIGKNGAGKSTLLKILSRIVEPTEGCAEIRGRVGSLLEVGTGFHTELTGRENIYLNGAILGMTKREINSKFDEIVAFSEIEKFIDTPVKRYSSGMYVRLAFAVAAHLEPEILFVDEVLSVGDAAFQKKCLGKMGDVASEGRTVLFVSHNMIAVKGLCSRAILLQNGQLRKDGFPFHIVKTYLESDRVSRSECVWENWDRAPGTELFRLHSIRIVDIKGNLIGEIDSRWTFDIEIQYWNLRSGTRLGTTVVLYNHEGICVLSSISNHEKKWHGRPRPEGLFRSVCRIPGDFLNEGRYSVNVIVFAEGYSSSYEGSEVLEFEVYDSGGIRGDYFGGWSGVVRPLLQWNTEQVD